MPRSSWVPPPTGATACPFASAAPSASASSSALVGASRRGAATPSISSTAVVIASSPAHRAPATRKQFQAPAGGREHLAGVAQPFRVECIFDALHDGHVGLAEDQRHQVLLLHADAVLA